jgi:hypothetical protein
MLFNKLFFSSIAGLGLWIVAADVVAADADTSPVEVEAEEAAPVTTDVPAIASPPEASSRPICLLGVGRDNDDAETVATLVCETLRERGVPVVTVRDEVPAPEVYRVNLRPLGSTVFLELVHESPPGTVLESRRLQLADIEESTVAAGRLVEALVNKVPVEETARSSTLVSGETRDAKKRPTRTRALLGVTGVMVGTQAGYGADFAIGFVGEEYGSQIRGRLAGSDAWHVSLGVSAWRYLGSGGEMVPFIGLNAGVAHLNQRTSEGSFGGGGGIVGPIVGLEVFRFDRSRLQITLQLDVPLFRLEGESRLVDGTVEREKRYVLAGGLGAAYVF